MQGRVPRQLQHEPAVPVIARPRDVATTCLRRIASGGFAGILAITMVSSSLAAQEVGQRCRTIDFENQSNSTRVSGGQQPDGTFIDYAGGGIIVLCRTEGIRLVADSAEYHRGSEIVYLFGRVRYTEGSTSVAARRITYWKRDERILAEGDVVARLDNGTTMTGPRADYLRAEPALRPRAQLRATERPNITLVQRDTARARAGAGSPTTVPPASGRGGRGSTPPPAAAARPDTTVVDANTVFMDGDSLIYASGRVVVTRPDLVATSDSLALDRAAERARFIGNPVMRGSGERAFTLSGSVIDIFSRERRLERVLSRVNAKVVSDDIELNADTIDLRIREDLLERAFAFGTKRARAVSAVQDMTADSIEILMPRQRLQEVRAVGSAFAQSEPDSTRIVSEERDWIRGDTVIARFDSVPLTDTTSKPRIRELRSMVRASSFYQIPPDDSTSRCPKINYSRGDLITVAFDSQSVASVAVAATRDSALADGVYLECQTARTPAGARATPDAVSPAGSRRPAAPPPAPGSPPPVGRPPE